LLASSLLSFAQTAFADSDSECINVMRCDKSGCHPSQYCPGDIWAL